MDHVVLCLGALGVYLEPRIESNNNFGFLYIQFLHGAIIPLCTQSLGYPVHGGCMGAHGHPVTCIVKQYGAVLLSYSSQCF